MKKLLAIVCLFVLYVGVTAARADELVDMHKKCIQTRRSIQSIDLNRP